MDCWLLVRAELPALPLNRWSGADAPELEAHRDREALSGRWVRRWPPRPGDVVLMGVRGDLSHAGVCVAPGKIRHWHRRHGAVVQPVSLLAQVYSRMEAWQWVG